MKKTVYWVLYFLWYKTTIGKYTKSSLQCLYKNFINAPLYKNDFLSILIMFFKVISSLNAWLKNLHYTKDKQE